MLSPSPYGKRIPERAVSPAAVHEGGGCLCAVPPQAAPSLSALLLLHRLWRIRERRPVWAAEVRVVPHVLLCVLDVGGPLHLAFVRRGVRGVYGHVPAAPG